MHSLAKQFEKQRDTWLWVCPCEKKKEIKRKTMRESQGETEGTCASFSFFSLPRQPRECFSSAALLHTEPARGEQSGVAEVTVEKGWLHVARTGRSGCAQPGHSLLVLTPTAHYIWWKRAERYMRENKQMGLYLPCFKVDTVLQVIAKRKTRSCSQISRLWLLWG